jgi:1-acyl-sn-glycerol-3-phosphate acyltransferase
LIRIIHSILTWTICILVVVIGRMVVPLFALLAGKGKERVYFRGAQFWARLLILMSGSKIVVIGKENIPQQGAAIFASSHQSFVDIPILLDCIDHPFVFAAREPLFHIPFFGGYIKRMGCISVSGKTTDAFKMIRLTVRKVESGSSLLIFPEGSRTMDGKLAAIGQGTGIMAQHTGASVVPIIIKGAYDILPRGTLTLRPKLVTVQIGKPLIFPANKKAKREDYLRVTSEIEKAMTDLFNQGS